MSAAVKGEINLLAIDRDDLREVVREMLQEDDLLSLEKIEQRFSFSESFVRTLVREGKINSYPVADHSKVVRYSKAELMSVFVKMQSNG